MTSERQEKANARARALGFANDYARRKAKGIKRDYALERERRQIRAAGRGFESVSEQTRFNKSGKTKEQWQRDRVLNVYGITQLEFNRIRRENRKWAETHNSRRAAAINRYSLRVDGEVGDWSRERVGYILAFNGAVIRGKGTANRSVKDWYKDLIQYGGDLDIEEYDTGYGDRSLAAAIAAANRGG